MKAYVNWKKTGMNIKRLMKKNGYTTKTLAPLINLSESGLKNYIYSGVRIPVENLLCLVRVFGIEDILVFEEINYREEVLLYQY